MQAKALASESEDALRTALCLRGYTLLRTELFEHVLGPFYQVLTVVCTDVVDRESKRADLFDKDELRDVVFLRLWVECHYRDLLAERGAVLRQVLEASQVG